MKLKLIAGQANVPLAESVARRLNVGLVSRKIRRFPDGELHVELDDTVRGDDVYIVEPTGPPVEERIFELLFLADACRRAGAGGLTAVVPYFGYARQDRRASGREAVGARVVADLLAVSGIQRLVAVDLHVVSLEGFFAMPLEHLTAVPVLLEHVRTWVSDASVVVAPDLGAAKLAERYSSALHLPVAIVHKQRLTGEQVRAHAISGDVRDRVPIIVDDMVSTGGTIEAAAAALLSAGCRPEISVAATHGVLAGAAFDRLPRLGLKRFVVTDSLTIPSTGELPLEVVSVASLLAEAIDRLHRRQSLDNLLRHE
jgi:ribose-phosphate pyrophosphokinase